MWHDDAADNARVHIASRLLQGDGGLGDTVPAEKRRRGGSCQGVPRMMLSCTAKTSEHGADKGPDMFRKSEGWARVSCRLLDSVD